MPFKCSKKRRLDNSKKPRFELRRADRDFRKEKPKKCDDGIFGIGGSRKNGTKMMVRKKSYC